jgi:3-oxoacyl-[acyl-carrier-protein] synthase II
MMRRRVVVTGMGAVTPIGHSMPATFAAAVEGRSGIDWITHFQAGSFPTKFAAEVKGFDLSKHLKNAARYAKCGVNTQFSLAAAQQALDEADLRGVDRERIGVYLGAGEGSEDFDTVISGIGMACTDGRTVDYGKFAQAAVKMLDPEREVELEMNTTAGHLAEEFELLGPNFTCLTACAASAQAVGEALEMIRIGEVDVMVAGGAHSMIHAFGVTGFNLLTALSTRNQQPQKASRPFDLNRDGFVLGEGSGVVVLEELEHAKKRGAMIYAELTGYGTTGDAYRMTDPHPEARGAGKCMAQAITDAGIRPEDIGYINAHGTSTKANDESETLGIKMALGAAAYKTPISSTKSMLGHLIAAGGVVELMIAIHAMRQNVLPPTINYETPDPECDLDYVPNTARAVTGIRHVLTNSFGFGGQNIALIASRYS